MTVLGSLARRFALFSLLAALCVSFMVPCRAASTVLAGEVVLPYQARIVEPVWISVEGVAYSRRTMARTDGRFYFDDVPPGDYVIDVQASGYERTQLELSNWSAADPRSIVINLRPTTKEDVPLRDSDPTVSIRELKIPEQALREAGKAQSKSRQKEYGDAAKHLEKALKIYPQWADAWNNLGVAYLGQGREKDAEAAFEKAWAMPEGCNAAGKNLGLIYLHQSRNQEAVNVLSATVEKKPTDAECQAALALGLFREGHYAEAKDHLLKALAARPDFPWAVFQLALVQIRLNEYEAAHGSLEQYLAKEPNGEDATRARELIARLEGRPQRQKAE